MKEEVERIKKLVGIDHNRWEQPCTCDKCKNMCKVPCIGTPKDIEAIIDAGYADRLKETMWMVGYLAVKEKPIAMIQPTEKDGWCAFRRPDGLCELHDRGLKPTEGVLASCKMIEEDNVPTYETSVLRAVANEWVKVESCQSDWFKIDREIFMLPENKNKIFILGTRKTGCDLIMLHGTNCNEITMDRVFGCLGNEKFYVCQPISLYKTQQNIQERPALYVFKIATAYFREQSLVPVFEDCHCKLMKL